MEICIPCLNPGSIFTPAEPALLSLCIRFPCDSSAADTGSFLKLQPAPSHRHRRAQNASQESQHPAYRHLPAPPPKSCAALLSPSPGPEARPASTSVTAPGRLPTYARWPARAGGEAIRSSSGTACGRRSQKHDRN